MLLYHIPKNIRLAERLFYIDKLKFWQYLKPQQKIEYLDIIIDSYVSTLNKKPNNSGNFKFPINNKKFIQACIENTEYNARTELKLWQYLEPQQKIEYLDILIDSYVSTLNMNPNNSGNFKFLINNKKFIRACIENIEFRV